MAAQVQGPVDPVFMTGGTGYIGRPLIEALLAKGYSVHALIRPGSESGCSI
jgi:nucleoside-diphosphate-sugar epimerase